MNNLQHSMDRILAAWPTLSEQDRAFILAMLKAIAERFAPEVQP